VLDRQRLRTFLLGGVAGVLAGILLAPRSGKELRGSIAERAGEARERSRETYFEAQERMRERMAEAREGSRPRPEDADPAAAGLSPEEETPVVPQRPRLRDVSRDVVGEEPEEDTGPGAERSEELRRKVQETRARLKERLDGPGAAGSERGDQKDQKDQEDHDLRPER
jgi:gas vesicle protein